MEYKVNKKRHKLINKITVESLKKNKGRSIVTIAAITLTTVLFTSLLTIMLDIQTTYKDQTIRMIGADGHASIKYIDDQIYSTIKNDRNIEEISYGVIVADKILNKELMNTTMEMWYMDSPGIEMYNCNPVEGEYPKKVNEIMIDTTTLTKLGVPAKIGQNVNIQYGIGDKEFSKDFILSGYYEADSLLDIGRVFVSKSHLIENTSELKNTYKEDGKIAGTVNCNIFFKKSWNIEKELTKLLNRYGYCWENTGKEVDEMYVNASISPAYTGSNIGEDPSILVGLVVITIFFIITGYLLIYNIFQISILHDIHFYGQLISMGAVKKQIRSLVKKQATYLAVIGIPIGLVIGFILGCMIAPSILKSTTMANEGKVSFSFNPIVFVVAIIFVIITLKISTMKPAKIAAIITPVEAIRFIDNTDIRRKNKKRRNGGKTYRLALANLERNLRRTILAILSMTCGLVLFMLITVFINSMNVDKYVSTQINSDFIIANKNYFNNTYITDAKGLEEDYIHAIENQKGYKNGGRIYFPRLFDKNRAIMEGFSIDNINPSDSDYGIYTDGRIYANVYGIERFILEKFNVVEGEIDLTKWNEGGYIIQGIYTEEDAKESLEIGESITINHYNENEGTYETKEYTLMAKVLANEGNTARGSSGIILYMPDREYLSIVDDISIMNYSFDYNTKYKDEVTSFVSSLVEGTEGEIDMESQEAVLKSFNDTTKSIALVGYALSGIVGLIGIINFINSMVSSVFARKKELAMLQSIGLSDNQLRKMLVYESVYYIISTIILSAGLSTVLSVFFMKPILNTLDWFEFKLTFVPLNCSYIVLGIIGIVLPLVLYKNISKQSIVEQLKELE